MDLPTWRSITRLKFSRSSGVGAVAAHPASSTMMRRALIGLRPNDEDVGRDAERLGAAGLRQALGHFLDHLVDLAALLLDEERARRAADLPRGKGLGARAI